MEDAMTRTPDYQRIANESRSCIASGDMRPGDRLPSIRQLQEVYGVSAQPVKKRPARSPDRGK